MTQARKRIPTPPPKRKAASRPAKVTQPPFVHLDKPNAEDPLSEPSRHRRVWAAYLARGMTRRQFAQTLGTNYHTVNRWDAGAAVMSLEMLERAAPLLGYSMDELCFGKQGTPAPRVRHTTAALAESEIRMLLDHLRADAVTRAAFGEHVASPAGRYQAFTGAYVETWCGIYAATRDETQALQGATNARASTEVVAAGLPSVSAEALRKALRGKP